MSTLNEYKEKQLVEKLNRMKVSNLSKEDIIKSFSRQELELIKSEFKNMEDVIQKGKAATIGEIREWSGKKYKKQPNGKWLEVSEHGMTKEEHKTMSNPFRDWSLKTQHEQENEQVSDELSDKEHSDEEVGLGREQGSSFKDKAKYSQSDFNKWVDSIKNNKDVEVIKEGDLSLIYLNGNKHIGTYNRKEEVMMADDMKLFGN